MAGRKDAEFQCRVKHVIMATGRKESCCVTRIYLGIFVKESAWNDRITEISRSSNSPYRRILTHYSSPVSVRNKLQTLMGSRSSDQATGWKVRGLNLGRGKRSYSFPRRSHRTGVQPRPYLICTRVRDEGVKSKTHTPLLPRLRMSGSLPPLPSYASWRGQGQLYFSLRYFSYSVLFILYNQ